MKRNDERLDNVQVEYGQTAVWFDLTLLCECVAEAEAVLGQQQDISA